MPSPPSPLSIRHDAHEQREMQPQIRERFTDASSEAGAAYRRGAGSGNERGEKPGARLRCGSEDIDSPVEKGTEHQEPDERMALEESLRGFVRSAPRANIFSWTHHVTAIAAGLQSGHASPLFCMPKSGRAKERSVSSGKVGDGSHSNNQASPSIYRYGYVTRFSATLVGRNLRFSCQFRF